MIAVITGVGPIAAAAGVIVALLLVDLVLFARGREPTFREGVIWSIAWLVLSLLVAPLIAALGEGDVAVDYTTVYLIERTLSLDNLFVFLLLFTYFGVGSRDRPKLLFWGIVLALVMRGLAIMGGTALILLVTVLRSMRETLDPDKVIPLGFAIIGRNYLGLLRHRRFMCYTLAGGFGSAGMFAYIAGSPRVFIDLFHVDPRYFGLLFGLNAASLIVASQVSARLLSRHVPDTLLRRAQVTLVAMTLAALLLTLTGTITLLLLMLCLMGFMASQGFVNPNAAALALSEQGHRLGVASALMGTLQMLCGATSGLAVSLWQSSTPLPLTGMLALCATLSWLFGRAAQRAA
jgi:predicted MFS family arabinose efflux permease